MNSGWYKYILSFTPLTLSSSVAVSDKDRSSALIYLSHRPNRPPYDRLISVYGYRRPRRSIALI